MKVTQTLVATTPDGEAAPHVKPVEMTWYRGDSLIEVAHAVTQILAHSEDRKFTKTLAISVEL